MSTAGWVQRAAPLVFLGLPLRQLHDALRADTIAGQRGEALYTTLYAGAQVRRWLSGVAPGRADLAVDGGTWWPEHPLAALWQATAGSALGDGLAYSLLLFGGSVLAGFGTWRWLRVHTGSGPWGPAMAGALLLQTSPLVLRPAVIGELGGLGLGFVALALAGGPVGALLAGLWSVPAGLAVLAAGLLRRRWSTLVVLLPLAVAFASPRSAVPGGARFAPPAEATVPAYVASNLAVIPLPPAEQEALLAARRAMPEAGSDRGPPPKDLPSRFPGGLIPALALGVGLALGERRAALLGLAALGLLLAGIGLLPVLGEPLTVAPAWLPTWLPGLCSTTGTAGWCLPMALAAAAALARPRLRAAAWGLVVLQLVAERPLHVPEVANIAPEPAELAVLSLPPGEVVVFPSPAPPWLQGRRSAAELLFGASRHQHPVAIGLGPPRTAALSLWLSGRLDLPVDLAAGSITWPGRGQDPFAQAEAAGATALLVDRSQMDAATLAALEGALARVVGLPIVSHGAWAVHGLRVLDLPPPVDGGAP